MDNPQLIDSCTICQEEIKFTNIIMSTHPCNHMFHSECMQEYIAAIFNDDGNDNGVACPNCRELLIRKIPPTYINSTHPIAALIMANLRPTNIFTQTLASLNNILPVTQLPPLPPFSSIPIGPATPPPLLPPSPPITEDEEHRPTQRRRLNNSDTESIMSLNSSSFRRRRRSLRSSMLINNDDMDEIVAESSSRLEGILIDYISMPPRVLIENIIKVAILNCRIRKLTTTLESRD